MKLRIQFKDPDLIGEYIYQAAKSDDARDELSNKYFQYGDYGMVELDTETKTWRFVPVNEQHR